MTLGRYGPLSILLGVPGVDRKPDPERPRTITVTETRDGWTKGDKQCAYHRTGYSAGCMTCRSLPNAAQ